MKQATRRNTPAKEVETDEDTVPASAGLPKDVHAKITTEARKNERTFAAQFRLIAKEWAEKQPA